MVELVGQRGLQAPAGLLLPSTRWSSRLQFGAPKVQSVFPVPATRSRPCAPPMARSLNMAAFSGLRRVDHAESTATAFAATPLWALGPGFIVKAWRSSIWAILIVRHWRAWFGTGTHGTGRTLGSLSSAVAGFRIILADGGVLNCSATENPEIFAAGRVAMGTLGVMTEITMRVRPAYRLAEKNFLLSPQELFSQLDSLVAEQPPLRVLLVPLRGRRGLQDTQ